MCVTFNKLLPNEDDDEKRRRSWGKGVAIQRLRTVFCHASVYRMHCIWSCSAAGQGSQLNHSQQQQQRQSRQIPRKHSSFEGDSSQWESGLAPKIFLLRQQRTCMGFFVPRWRPHSNRSTNPKHRNWLFTILPRYRSCCCPFSPWKGME